jgi:hypothetical protein
VAGSKNPLVTLKRLGLFRGNTRKKLYGYTKALLKKFAAVLAGRTKAVRVPSAKAAKEASSLGRYEHKGKTVLVPVQAGQRPRYSKKRRGIVISQWKAPSLYPRRRKGLKPVLVLKDGAQVFYRNQQDMQVKMQIYRQRVDETTEDVMDSETGEKIGKLRWA